MTAYTPNLPAPITALLGDDTRPRSTARPFNRLQGRRAEAR